MTTVVPEGSSKDLQLDSGTSSRRIAQVPVRSCQRCAHYVQLNRTYKVLNVGSCRSRRKACDCLEVYPAPCGPCLKAGVVCLLPEAQEQREADDLAKQIKDQVSRLQDILAELDLDLDRDDYDSEPRIKVGPSEAPLFASDIDRLISRLLPMPAPLDAGDRPSSPTASLSEFSLSAASLDELVAKLPSQEDTRHRCKISFVRDKVFGGRDAPLSPAWGDRLEEMLSGLPEKLPDAGFLASVFAICAVFEYVGEMVSEDWQGPSDTVRMAAGDVFIAAGERALAISTAEGLPPLDGVLATYLLAYAYLARNPGGSTVSSRLCYKIGEAWARALYEGIWTDEGTLWRSHDESPTQKWERRMLALCLMRVDRRWPFLPQSSEALAKTFELTRICETPGYLQDAELAPAQRFSPFRSNQRDADILRCWHTLGLIENDTVAIYHLSGKKSVERRQIKALEERLATLEVHLPDALAIDRDNSTTQLQWRLPFSEQDQIALTRAIIVAKLWLFGCRLAILCIPATHVAPDKIRKHQKRLISCLRRLSVALPRALPYLDRHFAGDSVAAQELVLALAFYTATSSAELASNRIRNGLGQLRDSLGHKRPNAALRDKLTLLLSQVPPAAGQSTAARDDLRRQLVERIQGANSSSSPSVNNEAIKDIAKPLRHAELASDRAGALGLMFSRALEALDWAS